MIYELQIPTKAKFVRPSIALAIADQYDQDMEFDGASSRLKQTGFKRIFRYNYSDMEIAAGHFERNMTNAINLTMRSHWTAFWCFRRFQSPNGKLFVAFQDDADAVMFKIYWNKSNVFVS